MGRGNSNFTTHRYFFHFFDREDGSWKDERVEVAGGSSPTLS